MKDKNEISGNRIDEILLKKGMCKQELADMVGTNLGHICIIASGKRKSLSLPIAMKIATALGEKVEDIFYIDKK